MLTPLVPALPVASCQLPVACEYPRVLSINPGEEHEDNGGRWRRLAFFNSSSTSQQHEMVRSHIV